MLKGLALTPPVVGRISIGRMVEKNGKRLPEKDDEFTITSQVQGRDGWIPHPLDQDLRQQGAGKLRTIPVRLVFDDPDLNLRASYSLFDRTTGRPLCVGNGESCRRATSSGIRTMPCPAPEGCELGQREGCKPYGRMNVRIGDVDEFGSFVFRTTGFNSIRTLATRMQYLWAASGGLLSTLPLELKLRGKSTALSHRTPVYYVDLTLRSGVSLPAAVCEAKARAEERRSAGIDQAALEEAARAGIARGAFEESAEDGTAVVEEFYPPQAQQSQLPAVDLADKLARKVAALGTRRSNV